MATTAKQVIFYLVLSLAVWFGVFFGLVYPEVQANSASSGSECTVTETSLSQSYSCIPQCTTAVNVLVADCYNGTSPSNCDVVVAEQSSKDPSQCAAGSVAQCATGNVTCCSSESGTVSQPWSSACTVGCNIDYTAVIAVQYESQGDQDIRTHSAWIRFDYGSDETAAVNERASYLVNQEYECWYDDDDFSQVTFVSPAWTWWKWLLLAIPSAAVIVCFITLTSSCLKATTKCSSPFTSATAMWLGLVIPIVILIPISTGNITKSSQNALICAIASFVAVGLCALLLPCINSCNKILPCVPGVVVCCCIVIPIGVFIPLALVANVSTETKTILLAIAPSLTIFPCLFAMFFVCYQASERRKAYGNLPVRPPDGDDCSPSCWGDIICCPCYGLASCCQSIVDPGHTAASLSPVRNKRRVSPVDASHAWPTTNPSVSGAIDLSRRDTERPRGSEITGGLHSDRPDESTISMPPTPLQPALTSPGSTVTTLSSPSVPMRRVTLHPGLPGHHAINLLQASPIGARSMSVALPSGQGAVLVPPLNALTIPPSPGLTVHYPQHTPLMVPLALPRGAAGDLLVPPAPLGVMGPSQSLPLPPLSARGGQFTPYLGPRVSIPSLALTPQQQAALQAHAQGHSLSVAAAGSMTTPHRAQLSRGSFSLDPSHPPLSQRGQTMPNVNIHSDDEPQDGDVAPAYTDGNAPPPPIAVAGRSHSAHAHHLSGGGHGHSPSLSTNASITSVRIRHHSIDGTNAPGLDRTNSELVRIQEQQEDSQQRASAQHSRMGSGGGAVLVQVEAEGIKTHRGRLPQYQSLSQQPPAYSSSGSNSRRTSVTEATAGGAPSLPPVSAGVLPAVPPSLPAHLRGSSATYQTSVVGASSSGLTSITVAPPTPPLGAATRSDSPLNSPLFTPDEHAVKPKPFSPTAIWRSFEARVGTLTTAPTSHASAPGAGSALAAPIITPSPTGPMTGLTYTIPSRKRSIVSGSPDAPPHGASTSTSSGASEASVSVPAASTAVGVESSVLVAPPTPLIAPSTPSLSSVSITTTAVEVDAGASRSQSSVSFRDDSVRVTGTVSAASIARARLPPLGTSTSALQPKALKPLAQPGSGSSPSVQGRPRSQSAARRP